MKSRPMLFSAPMVRALLDDTKTQTRRIVKPEGAVEMVKMIGADNLPTGEWGWCPHPRYIQKYIRCPYGQVGDRLWVRETCRAEELPTGLDGVRYMADEGFVPIEPNLDAVDGWLTMRDYGKRASPVAPVKTVPAIHMPRWASRITLEITGIRAERLNDISEADALAEGIRCERVIVDTNCNGGYHQEVHDDRYFFPECRDEGYEFATEAYEALWEQINGAGSWAANPFVWVISFRKL